MDMTIERMSAIPIYAQVERRIADAIAAGELACGDRLPSTPSLAASLGVSDTSVRRAYAGLRGRGLIATSSGKRAVVTASSPDDARDDEDAQRVRAAVNETVTLARAAGLSDGELREMLAHALSE